MFLQTCVKHLSNGSAPDTENAGALPVKASALEEQATHRRTELRQALGLTQAELAELIGKSQSAISQIEHGEIGLSLELLRAIVAQLGGEVEIAAVFDDRRVRLEV